jgi:hypothetical protein
MPLWSNPSYGAKLTGTLAGRRKISFLSLAGLFSSIHPSVARISEITALLQLSVWIIPLIVYIFIEKPQTPALLCQTSPAVRTDEFGANSTASFYIGGNSASAYAAYLRGVQARQPPTASPWQDYLRSRTEDGIRIMKSLGEINS